MPEAILFDMDDTLIAHASVSQNCWSEICQRFRSRLNGTPTDKLTETIVRTAEWYWSDPERHQYGRLRLFATRREIVSMAFDSLGIHDPTTADEIADAYSEEREAAARLIPGTVETLTYFRDTNRKLGMVTNGASDIQRAKIERFRLAGFFHHIIVEGEFGQGKPEKQVFRNMLKKLETKAVDAWMVGDDLERDIAGAQSVGIYAVWVDWRGRGLPPESRVKPDRIVRSISELV